MKTLEENLKEAVIKSVEKESKIIIDKMVNEYRAKLEILTHEKISRIVEGFVITQHTNPETMRNEIHIITNLVMDK